MAEIVHLCPPDGSGATPCCGQSPFELPRDDRVTLDPSRVTCYADMTDLVIRNNG